MCSSHTPPKKLYGRVFGVTGFIKSLHLAPVSEFASSQGQKRWHHLEMLDQGLTAEVQGERGVVLALVPEL